MRLRDWPATSRAAALLILILAGILYVPSMQGLLVWDDHLLVSGQAIGGGRRFTDCFMEPFLSYYYRPMVSASFYIDHLVWRNTPFGYHQTNLFIHVLTTLALMAFLNTAFRNRAVALWGGALFAAQPAQVSTVAWIGGRTDSLCTLFVACFACCLAAGIQAWGWRKLCLMSGAIIFYSAAIFTKEQMLALLPLVPLAFYSFGDWRGSRLRSARNSWDVWRTAKKRKAMTVTTACLGVSVLFVACWLMFVPLPSTIAPPNLIAQMAQGGRTVSYYAFLLLTPTRGLMHLLCLGTFEEAGAWPVALGFGIMAAALFLWFRWIRTQPACAWLLTLILLTILPVSNFIPMPSLLVAPYRAGTTGLGVAALLGWLLGRNWGREALDWRADKVENDSRPFRPARVFPALAGLVMIAWTSTLTAWGAGRWSNEQAIFSTIVRYDPYSIIARINLTAALLQKHDSRLAITHLEYTMGRLFGSDAWRSGPRAVAALQSDGRIMARIRENQGNRVDPKEWLATLFAQLGFARLDTQDLEEGLQAFKAGEALYASAQINLGLGECESLSGDIRMAEIHLRRAYALQPEETEIQIKLGKTLSARGKWNEARALFAKSIRLQPWAGQAYIELANAQRHLGDRAGASATLQEALRRSPRRGDIRHMLAEL